MSWLTDLDLELGLPLTAAACQNLGPNCRCELDFVNGAARIVALQPVTPSAGQAVREAVRARALELRPDLVDFEIYLKSPATTTYTSHLFEFPQNIRPFAAASYLTVFDLPLSQIFALREAEAELARRARAAARVVAFALGGVSTLTRISREEWDALAENPLTDGVMAADLIQEKYHLFPGLNWRMPGIKARFLGWIQNLAVTSRILIFDTGTEGNGLRQVFKLLSRQLPAADTAARLEVEIVGLVDGTNRDSVDGAYDGRSRNGNPIQLTLEYLQVPRVLSEDFQRLVGYKKLHQLGYLHPLRDLGIVRLVDDEGKLMQITGSDNIADVFRGYMTNAIGAPHRLARQGCEVLTPEIERALVQQVLDQGKFNEEEQLHQAWTIGLVTDAQARFLMTDIESRYAEELVRYPQHVYSFAEKKVREQFGSEDDVWVES